MATAWSAAGLRVRVVDPGTAVKYDWDLAGRLRSASGLEQRWERDALGRCVLHVATARRGEVAPPVILGKAVRKRWQGQATSDGRQA